MRASVFTIALVLSCFGLSVTAQPQRGEAGSGSSRSLTVVTEPKAAVWVDEIRRGSTNDLGRLVVNKIANGAHTLRVRANGFKEATMPISAMARGEIKVRLLRTTDQAELTFQQAETARETARDGDARQKAADLYRQTLKIRPAYPAAHVGLARVLLDLNDTDGALQEVDAARRYRANYPEASAIEGRIYRETGQTDDAIGAFNRAIRESRGFQPEAHVGLGRLYEEKGQYELAAREFKIAIAQLSDTEPIIYQLLGAAYEKAGENNEAIAAYENYLRLAPIGSLAPAVQSIVEQLKSQRPE
ncbi:MAG TPA: tetratricopeptide repeat protein [Pyrinomonadaceae bacterium]|nr:tetratricopeptide repeat protein [Pyrinomonadaceae bacterium]